MVDAVQYAFDTAQQIAHLGQDQLAFAGPQYDGGAVIAARGGVAADEEPAKHHNGDKPEQYGG